LIFLSHSWPNNAGPPFCTKYNLRLSHWPLYFTWTLIYPLGINNWRVSLSKICHEWPNNAVTHECAQRMNELQRYLVMSDIFFYNETRQLVIVFII
jgi:hypothetical protein